MKQWKWRMVCFGIGALCLTMAGNLSPVAAREIVQAPDNPEYTEFISNLKTKRVHARPFGRIPAPVDMTHLEGRSAEPGLAAELPSG